MGIFQGNDKVRQFSCFPHIDDEFEDFRDLLGWKFFLARYCYKLNYLFSFFFYSYSFMCDDKMPTDVWYNNARILYRKCRFYVFLVIILNQGRGLETWSDFQIFPNKKKVYKKMWLYQEFNRTGDITLTRDFV